MSKIGLNDKYDCADYQDHQYFSPPDCQRNRKLLALQPEFIDIFGRICFSYSTLTNLQTDKNTEGIPDTGQTLVSMDIN